VTSALAQPHETAEDVRLKAGVLTGIHVRRGESFGGSNGAMGGWVAIMAGKWGFDVDFSRSRRLERRGSKCVDLSCTKSVPGTGFERNAAIGIAAVREIDTSSRISPHFLFGLGSLSRKTAFRYEESALDYEEMWWGPGPVAGTGVDIVIGQHYIVTAQYRLNFRVEDSIHQFRLGLDWAN
jgi:hypothetical protein